MPTSYRLPIGGLISQSLSIYFGNLLPFTLLAAGTLAPWIVLRFYIEAMPVTTTNSTHMGMQAVATLLQTFGGQVLTGALTFGVVQKLRGQPADIGQIVGVGVRSFLRVLGVGIVYGLIVGLATLTIVGGPIVMTIFYVALPAAVLERIGVGKALGRSSDLTRGSRWQIFGAVVLLAIVMVGATALLLFLMHDSIHRDTLPAWVEVVLNLVLTPFSATIPAVCYFMLRSGKENIDSKQIAAVFD